MVTVRMPLGAAVVRVIMRGSCLAQVGNARGGMRAGRPTVVGHFISEAGVGLPCV